MSNQLVPVFSGEIGTTTSPTRFALQIPGIGPVRLVENTLTDDEREPDEQSPISLPAEEPGSTDRPIPVQVVPIFSGESGNTGRATQYALRVPGLGPLRMVENNLLEVEPPEVVEIPILEPEEQSVAATFKAELVPIFSGEIGLTTIPTQYALQVPGVGAIRMVENTLPIVIVYNIRRTLDNRTRRTTSGAIRRTSG